MLQCGIIKQILTYGQFLNYVRGEDGQRGEDSLIFVITVWENRRNSIMKVGGGSEYPEND